MSKTKNSTVPKSQGKRAAKGPAAVLRKQKAKLAEALKHPIPRMPYTPEIVQAHRTVSEQYAAAHREIGGIPVPMTLNEICVLMGPDCRAEEFGASALKTLAGQLYAVAQFAETGRGGDGGYNQWQVVENIVERMKCASEVVTWLETETTELPEVAP